MTGMTIRSFKFQIEIASRAERECNHKVLKTCGAIYDGVEALTVSQPVLGAWVATAVIGNGLAHTRYLQEYGHDKLISLVLRGWYAATEEEEQKIQAALTGLMFSETFRGAIEQQFQELLKKCSQEIVESRFSAEVRQRRELDFTGKLERFLVGGARGFPQGCMKIAANAHLRHCSPAQIHKLYKQTYAV